MVVQLSHNDEFPKSIFTSDEVERAKRLIEKGYKHRLIIRGSPKFKDKVKEALKLIKTARYHDFLRQFIRRIIEVDGLSQLRDVDASIWANMYTVADPIEAASYFIQKAEQMRIYLEGKAYFDVVGEASAVEKRMEFLEALKSRSRRSEIREKCETALRLFTESKFL